MRDQVNEVKNKVDIVSVIGARVELKRAGKNLKGLCPFHAERSPSFFVSPDMQSFKCFGCGEGGDVFTFLEKYDGLTFREVLEELADRVGVKLENYTPSSAESETKTLYEILHLAREYYQFLLLKHPVGQRGREYLKGRNIDEATIAEFELGFAPDAWDSLYKFLVVKKKYKAEMVEKAGLIIKSERPGNSRYYDRFRGRIMFPLPDFRGRVVGFSGRVLEADAKEVKYINTPETEIYHKRELLFGLSQAKMAIRKKGKVILVEGEFDAISSWKAGVRNVVAIKGSAVTSEQLKLLLRLTRDVILCLDADSAGEAATKRGIEEGDKLGVDMAVVVVSGGKDPDDLARSNPADWKELVSKPKSVYQFFVDSAFSRHDKTTGIGAKKIAEELVPVISKIGNSVEKAHYVKEVATRLGLSEDVINGEIERVERAEKMPLPAKNTSAPDKLTDRVDVLERYMWGVLLALENEWFVKGLALVSKTEAMSPGFMSLLSKINEFREKQGKFELKTFAATLPAELSGLLSSVYLSEDAVTIASGEESYKELTKVVEEFDMHMTKKQISKIANQIAEYADDEARLSDLQKEYARLTGKLIK